MLPVHKALQQGLVTYALALLTLAIALLTLAIILLSSGDGGRGPCLQQMPGCSCTTGAAAGAGCMLLPCGRCPPPKDEN